MIRQCGTSVDQFLEALGHDQAEQVRAKDDVIDEQGITATVACRSPSGIRTV